jgi:beta-xylosidase
MLKHKRRYYLMYSNGKTVEDSYQVHYAMGDSPFGPFTEATNSPILVTDLTRDVRGPGHHAVFRHAGRHFILYHRHSIPFDPDFIGRQICVDELTFMGDDLIAKVHPTQEGPPIMQRSRRGDGFRTEARATASSQRTPHTKADGVLDGNHATLWAADTNRGPAWLELDLGASRHFTQQELRFEYPWKHYRFRLEGSTDRQQWIPLADYSEDRIMGSPVILRVQARARFLRLTFPSYPDAAAPALFEWSVR